MNCPIELSSVTTKAFCSMKDWRVRIRTFCYSIWGCGYHRRYWSCDKSLDSKRTGLTWHVTCEVWSQGWPMPVTPERYLARQPRDTWPGDTWLGNWPVMQSCWTWKKGLTVGCLCRFRPYDAQTYHVVFDVVLVVQPSAALESLVFWIWWISVNLIALCGWQGVKYQVHVLTYFCP